MSKYIDTNAKLLAQLLEAGSLPSSLVKSKVTISLFDKLIQIGLIQKQRKGAGSQFSLINKERREVFIGNEYPSGLEFIENNMFPRRVQGIKNCKNSKSLKKLDFDLITLRGKSIIEYKEKNIDLSLSSDDVTYLSLKLEIGSLINIHQESCTIVTVENPTAFTELGKMVSCSWDIAVYTGGKMSEILINQLKYWGEKGHKIIHFGDYDFVGMEEFIRILHVCSDARFYLPESLGDEFVKNYGNIELLEKQVTQHKKFSISMSSLANTKGRGDLRKLHQLIQNNAKGLEQESLYSSSL